MFDKPTPFFNQDELTPTYRIAPELLIEHLRAHLILPEQHELVHLIMKDLTPNQLRCIKNHADRLLAARGAAR